MLSEVEQDVNQACADLARRAQHARMVSIAPQPAPSFHGSIHCQRDPDSEALHAPL
jgi:hypothetical protein